MTITIVSLANVATKVLKYSTFGKNYSHEDYYDRVVKSNQRAEYTDV